MSLRRRWRKRKLVLEVLEEEGEEDEIYIHIDISMGISKWLGTNEMEDMTAK